MKKDRERVNYEKKHIYKILSKYRANSSEIKIGLIFNELKKNGINDITKKDIEYRLDQLVRKGLMYVEVAEKNKVNYKLSIDYDILKTFVYYVEKE